jgi:hypothetical protein
MKESVAKLLSRLRSSGGAMETLSLNETRVRENFISQLGAIESYTRAATRGGSLETPFIKLGGAVSFEAGATWGLGDPITQALILRAALASQGSLHGLKDARPGQYVLSSGVGAISRSGMLDDLHRERLHKHPGLYEELEDERAKQENIMHMTGGNPEESLWLLTINKGADEDKSCPFTGSVRNGVAFRCCCDNVTVLWLMMVLRGCRLTGGCRTGSRSGC